MMKFWSREPAPLRRSRHGPVRIAPKDNTAPDQRLRESQSTGRLRQHRRARLRAAVSEARVKQLNLAIGGK